MVFICKQQLIIHLFKGIPIFQVLGPYLDYALNVGEFFFLFFENSRCILKIFYQ